MPAAAPAPITNPPTAAATSNVVTNTLTAPAQTADPSVAEQAEIGVRSIGFESGPGFGTRPRSLGRGDPQPPPALALGYILAAIFIPPLAVAVKTGDICETAINLW